MEEVYVETAAILCQLDKRETSFRKLVFESYYQNKKLLYKLCYETLMRRESLEKILLKVPKLAEDECFVDNPHLLLVLLYDYLYGHGLNKCPYEWRNPIESFSSELSQMKNLFFNQPTKTNEEMSEDNINTNNSSAIRLPRYARVNTLKSTLDNVLNTLEENRWNLVEIDSTLSRKDYRSTVDELQKRHFFVDVHSNDVLVFPSGTDLHRDPLVESGVLILQDKSSCLPPLCLECKPGDWVMDLCAAPGVKTSHLAALLHNEGQIFAYDKNFDRFRVMQELLSRNDVNCAEIECKDFLKLNFGDKKFKNITHVLLDPPCSGSGMVKRMDFLTNSNETVDEGRLKRLANLQTVMLKHALTLPNLKRLVYSTCSIYDQENECVIGEVLQSIQGRFHLVKALPSWKHRGRRGYDFGKMCLRASPEKDRTNGFFVAVLEKIY